MKRAKPVLFRTVSILLPLLLASGGKVARADEVAQGFLLMNMGAATAPGAGAKTMDYSVGLGQRDPGGNGGRVQQSLGGRVGWGDRSSIAAHGILGNNNNSGAAAEVATLLYKPSDANDYSLSVAGGWQTTGGIQHARARASLDKRWGAFSASLQTLLDHQFQSGADGVDYFVAAGASYSFTQALGLGVEYLGQDLESVFGDDAEGGARHTIGPVFSIKPTASTLRILVGPAYLASPQGPGWLGRAAVSFDL